MGISTLTGFRLAVEIDDALDLQAFANTTDDHVRSRISWENYCGT